MQASDNKIRVVVADDSKTALLSVCGYLEFEGQFEILGTANDGLHVIQQTERFHPELLLTDLSMPRMTGLQAAAVLRKSFPDLRILIFTGWSCPSLREECLLRCNLDDPSPQTGTVQECFQTKDGLLCINHPTALIPAKPFVWGSQSMPDRILAGRIKGLG